MQGDRSKFAVTAFPGESQYDPGFFRVLTGQAGTLYGSILVDDGMEHWCVDEQNFVPASSTNTLAVHSAFDDSTTVKVDDLPVVGFDCHRIDVTIEVNPSATSTGSGGATPTRPYLFAEGRYDVKQGGTKVGEVIVEHDTAESRKQYWFLFTEPGQSTGVYAFPGSQNEEITNTIQHAGSFPASTSLDELRRGIPAHVFILGSEVFHSTLPGSS